MQPGAFVLGPDTQILVPPSSDARTVEVAQYLAELLRPPTGLSVPVDKRVDLGLDDVILLTLDPSMEEPESYRLAISEDRIELAAKEPRGLFYGVQTLRQLAPEQIEADGPVSGVAWSFPALKIQDHPRFPYRGMHLDVGRHFFSVEFVKRYIDQLATYKMNTFHWHLTEDQGWRIEIKKYPKLTEVGAWREETLVGHNRDQPHVFDGERYGGYYTQDQIKEVVEYARRRFVTVIPEIELPGHSLAALAAYPELACTKGPFEVAKLWGIFEDVYCPKEETFAFLQDVLSEVIALFPSPYIHIGGDEVPKTRWKNSKVAQAIVQREGLENEEELQSYFIRRIERFLNENGRRLIGWDEILEGGLAPRATVMSWRGVEGGIDAAKQGHDVIMSPVTDLYFNMYQDNDIDSEPLAAGGHIPVEQVYDFEPIPPELSREQAKHVIGAQGNLWTEYIETPELAEYMVHPRLQALAEVVWSPRQTRDFQDFAERLTRDLDRLDIRQIHYGRHVFKVRQNAGLMDGRLSVALRGVGKGQIHYTLDGTLPDSASPAYRAPILLDEPATVTAVAIRDGRATAAPVKREYFVSLSTGKPAAYANAFSDRYPAAREFALTNGIKGSKNFGDGEWLGFNGVDLEVTLDLGSEMAISQIEVDFLRDVAVWIMLPKQVEFLGSTDGSSYSVLAKQDIEESERDTKPLIKTCRATIGSQRIRYLRVRAKNYGTLPDWHAGKGQPAWLFVSEIVAR